MTKQEFIALYGGVYENSPWIAEQLWQQRSQSGGDFTTNLAAEMEAIVRAAGTERQLELIRAHPDLAGRAAVRGALTAASEAEQASAGIDRCSPDQFDLFQRCNERYKRKFGFPFVMAIRGSDRAEILAAFEQRLSNNYAVEFSQALLEIHKIARLRLKDLADNRAG